jgi:hypothetical protein
MIPNLKFKNFAFLTFCDKPFYLRMMDLKRMGIELPFNINPM